MNPSGGRLGQLSNNKHWEKESTSDGTIQRDFHWRMPVAARKCGGGQMEDGFGVAGLNRRRINQMVEDNG